MAVKKTPTEVLRSTKKGALVEVEWDDAYSVLGWKDLDEFDETVGGLTTLTVGRLVVVSADCVVTASTVNQNRVSADTMVIPLGMVRSARVVEK